MKAMVFAAGYGRRLLPLTERVPKALIPIAGRPMIEYPLLLLRYYGITEVIINVHHLGEMIESRLGDGKKLGLRICYSREKELLDTGGGLRAARAFLADETFVVINSDILIDIPLNELIAHHAGKKATGTLVLRADERADDYGPIEVSPDLRIQKFLGHKANPNPPSQPLAKFMFTGLQVLEPRVFHYMDPDPAANPGAFSTTKVTYPRMLTRGEPIYGFPFDGYWQDLGTAERIREAEEKLKSGQVKLHFL